MSTLPVQWGESAPAEIAVATVLSIYGKPTRCQVLRVRPHGTLDVQRLSDGKCFRVSGLPDVRQLCALAGF